MADSYKDIIITPNRGNTADPKIEFRGANTSVNTSISLYSYHTSNGTLSFEGSAGQLFSITNDLNGSIFSVNDVSGIPSIEVFANGVVSLAGYNGNVGIGNTAPAVRLQIGTLSASSTATPETLSLGGTYSSTAGSNLKFRVYDDGTNSGGMSVSSGQLELNTWSSGKMAFYRGTTQSMIIDASGNVGIGTTSPSTALQVNGTTTTTGLTVSNTINGSINGNAATVTNGVYQNQYGSFQSSFTSNIDANVNRNVGAYGSYASGATNTPTNAGILLNFTSGSDGSGDGLQIWSDYNNANNLYQRRRWGGTWSSWGQIWTADNDGAGSGLDADTLDGYNPDVGGTTGPANTIVLRNANGDDFRRYGFAQYFNMSHSAATRSADTVFYSSNDAYIRKNDATGMRASLNVPTRTGGDASGTWGISITGNAGTVSNGMYLNANQVSTVRKLFAGSQSVGSLQSSGGSLGGLELYGGGTTNAAFMSFHRPGVYASYFGIDTDNQFAVGGWSAGAALAYFKCQGLGVGTAASSTIGEIRATSNVTAYYSDARLKEFKGKINNALNKVNQLNGYYYIENEIAEKYGYNNKEEQVGVSAQEVEAVLPHVVTRAPFDIAKNEDGTEYSKSGEDYKTVRYERLIPLLIEAIKELKKEVDELKKR